MFFEYSDAGRGGAAWKERKQKAKGNWFSKWLIFWRKISFSLELLLLSPLLELFFLFSCWMNRHGRAKKNVVIPFIYFFLLVFLAWERWSLVWDFQDKVEIWYLLSTFQLNSNLNMSTQSDPKAQVNLMSSAIKSQKCNRTWTFSDIFLLVHSFSCYLLPLSLCFFPSIIQLLIKY